MSGIPTQRTALFDALSSFWRRLFADRDQLRELMGGMEEMLGQAYLDLMHTVMNQSLDATPIYRKEYWYFLSLREDGLRFDSSEAFPYEIVLDDDIAEMSLLTNLIVNPTVALEDEFDFTYDFATRTLRLEFNPFDNPRIATRQVAIEPTVYATGTDATVDLDDSNTRVTFAGTLRRGRDGQTFSSNEFRSATAAFTSDDVGRSLTVGTTPTPTTAVIQQVVADDFVILDSALPTSETGRTWRLFTTELFTSFNEGEDLVLQDPVTLERTTYTISGVIDGLTITTEDVLSFANSLNQGIAWTHQSSENVREIGLWAPDAAIDRRDLYLNYGYLVNREGDSTESYKALLQGIYQYYILGPSLPRIESALNVFVGVPVVRNTEETILRIDLESDDTYDILTTDLERYELPKGSLREDLAIGDVVNAFDVLTTIFTVVDYITDHDWFHGKDIPVELIEGASLPDRSIDADLEPLQLGETWFIGEPRAFIGADEDTTVVTDRTGADGFYGPTLQSMYVVEEKSFYEEDLGKAIEIEGTLYDIVATGVTGTNSEFTYVTTTANVFNLAVANSSSGEVDATDTTVFTATGGLDFQLTDTGRLMFLTGASDVSMVGTRWRIVQFLSSTQVRVEFVGDGTAPVLSGGETFTYTNLLRWRIPSRPPYKHNIGYTMMRDYIQYNTAFLSYTFNSFTGVPFIRSDEDIREVLLAGKPSYVYFFIEGSNQLTDIVGVGDEQEFNLEINPQIVQEKSDLTIDGTWSIGDHFFHGGPEATPFEMVIRENDFGAGPIDILGAEDMDHIVFMPLYDGDPTATIDIEITAFNGTSYVPISGGSFTFDASTGPQLYDIETNGLMLRIEATVTGTPTQPGVAAMLRTVPPRVVTISPSAGYDSAVGSSSGNDELQDVANYTFYELDVQRELFLNIGGVRTPFRINSLVAADTVGLVNPDGTAAVLPVSASIEWAFGAPRQFAAPITIGQGTVSVERDTGISAYHMVDWPLLPKFVP